MREIILTVARNEKIARGTYRMELSGDVSDITSPGQFINIKLDGFFLRRPISVSDVDYEKDVMTIIYKVVGAGTEYMTTLCEGARLDVLSGLGNGFDADACKSDALLVGGGAGVAPLYMLAKALTSRGVRVSCALGFGTAEEIFLADELRALGCDVKIATVDGSAGVKGFVTDATDGDEEYLYVCGPEPMMKAVYKKSRADGQFSFESRMGCGFGACLCCTCKTVTGYKRICKDGPVLYREEILWEG